MNTKQKRIVARLIESITNRKFSVAQADVECKRMSRRKINAILDIATNALNSVSKSYTFEQGFTVMLSYANVIADDYNVHPDTVLYILLSNQRRS